MGRARLDPEDIDYINAHGSGTQQNDRHETAAFKREPRRHAYEVPVSSIKSMVGHSLGAIGAIEIAACALAIEHSVVPPTANLHEPDPEVRSRLRAAACARAAQRRRADRRQRVRRLPDRDAAHPARDGGVEWVTTRSGL